MIGAYECSFVCLCECVMCQGTDTDRTRGGMYLANNVIQTSVTLRSDAISQPAREREVSVKLLRSRRRERPVNV